jgi:hypothetical protein
MATYRKFPKYIIIFANNEGAGYLKKKTRFRLLIGLVPQEFQGTKRWSP